MFEQIKQLIQSGNHLFRQLDDLWNLSPKVDVHEQGNKVKVVVEAPGLMNGRNRHQWAIRIVDQNLFLRGQMDVKESARNDFGGYHGRRRTEQFTRVIPLPAPVLRKPSSVDYADGRVTIVLEKQKGRTDDDWHPLDFSHKSKKLKDTR